MFTRKAWFVLLVLVFVFTAVQPVAAAPNLAPILSADSPTAIEGQYIVVLNPTVAEVDLESVIATVANTEGVTVLYRYTSALQGFAARLPVEAVEALRRNPAVSYIEVDQVITLDATQSPATWGIDRIDQRSLPLSNSYTYNYTGAGVTVYIIDTGIYFSHTD